MAKVSLRNYIREIGALIEQGLTEEAVGHCHHILKTFPKHLETYRLLGKAYLEARRYNDAADIFSRTIMSVPDDFVSHVGMSLIADEKEQLDIAIWHMERAFESQPSNAAVQGELQRLYGRRDGVEPPKVRMTSGALANVYVQGELYPQAIAEITSVESRDPGRVDMQVLLAIAYFRSGQRVEASQVASDLLAKRPYCFDANRILIEVLPGTARSESTQTYRDRVNALDPYAAFIKDSVFNISDVPDAAVNLDRLDWKPGSLPQLASGWGDTLGIKLDQNEEEQPAWLKEGGKDSEFEPAFASKESAGEDNIPDFMRAAGWDSSSGEAEEESSILDEPEPKEDGIAQGVLPDWMKSMAPSDEALAGAENLDGVDDDAGDDMAANEWMDDLLGDESESEEKKPEDPPKDDTGIEDATIGTLGTSADDQDEALNWLEGLAANQGANPDELITDPNARTEAAPDWVQKTQDAEADEPAAEDQPSLEETDLPRWLQGDDETGAEEISSIPSDEKSPVSEVEASPEIADKPLIADPSIGDLGASGEDQDAALNWLESLATNQGANPDELITDPNARTEDAPEWVEQAKEGIDQETPASMDAPIEFKSDAVVEEISEKPESDGVEDPQVDLPSETVQDDEVESPSDTALWLNKLAVESAVAEEDANKDDSVKNDDFPAWLADMEGASTEEEKSPTSGDDLPTGMKDEEEVVAPSLQPTKESEWQPIEDAPKVESPASSGGQELSDAKQPKEEKPAQAAASSEPQQKPAKPPQKEKSANTDVALDPALATAQAALEEGNVPAALEEYGKMIKKKRLLDEIIHDLREALYEYPVDIPILQMLGDAYIRAGRLQEALDTYSKAEDLLR